MRRNVSAALLMAAAALTAAAAFAEPFESNPNLSASDADYAAGKQAMEKKNWSEAAKRFAVALKRNPDSADLQNYLGYTHRNLKQYELAFKYYKRAIELEPRHRGAHEYIGEAYLLVNDLPNAEKHLAALRAICLLPCEELDDLEREVAAYRSKRPG
ncbi:MAG TPA: tetratricopeptide repeat protein [Burkholderiales bacterium]|jgi:tetratricopeptide (TPR) repeat protein|nr:tetratricopeptide repeat protein [Burkholderiales bacterium]